MPIFHQAKTHAGTRAVDHPSFLTLCMLGTGYDWAFQASAKWFPVHICRHRQVLKKIKYKPLVLATTKKAVELFKDIIHRFGLPNSIITDLGTMFTGHHFWDFCEDRCISIKYVSVAHPRANDQVKWANGMILDALKKEAILERRKASGQMAQRAVSYGLGTAHSS